jgi:hypothetical protein
MAYSDMIQNPGIMWVGRLLTVRLKGIIPFLSSVVLGKTPHTHGFQHDPSTTLPVVFDWSCFFAGASYTGFFWQQGPLRVFGGNQFIPCSIRKCLRT